MSLNKSVPTQNKIKLQKTQTTSQNPLLQYPPALSSLLLKMAAIRNPCFVYGSVGRTTLIKSCFPQVKIYDAREVLDVKNVGGFYAIKDGVLSQARGLLAVAMEEGHSICFRNIDENPSLLQYLRPVINGRCLLDSLGNKISPNGNFRLFFTCKAPINIRNVSFIGPVEFCINDAMPLFGSEWVLFMGALKIIISDNGINGHGNINCSLPSAPCHKSCLKSQCFCFLSSGPLCALHFRGLCLIASVLRIQDPASPPRLSFYQSLVNVFLRHNSRPLAEYLLVTPLPAILPDMLFARTAPVEETLKALLLNIKTRTPTLLVGETGAGKTALIQYLCSNSNFFFKNNISLRVVNMSSDFDSTDLIGGYRSFDIDGVVRDLCKKVGVPPHPTRIESLRILSQSSDLSVADSARRCLSMLEKGIPFIYKDGILTQAMRNGEWLLLDEINLCTEETLGLIEAVLDRKEVILQDTGEVIPVHGNFMLFGCMNPHGDFGKKNYKSLVFNRIEFFDFSCSINCIKAVTLSITRNRIEEGERISEFYYELKGMLFRREISNIIEPLITGRTLCRALRYIVSEEGGVFRVQDERTSRVQDERTSTVQNKVQSTVQNRIKDAVNLLFFTQLDLPSRAKAQELFNKYFPKNTSQNNNPNIQQKLHNYIVTSKTQIHISDIELAISANLPVLIQGDTSTGKTSLIYALAHKHRKRVIRINNHSQTDAADYIGGFSTRGGEVIFREGPLVTAMKAGDWVLLDELNLAPSDVLEVLNRLLDDNRELYIPEIDKTITPHESFRLFASQNHTNYGGRQGLAKSFRNRFIEIFFYQKDEAEITEILEKASKIPTIFSKRIISVYGNLKRERSIKSLITIRDLFKWVKRDMGDYYELYRSGMELIYERLRTEEDRGYVIEVFKKVFEDRMGLERRDYLELYKKGEEGLNIEQAIGLEQATEQAIGHTPSPSLDPPFIMSYSYSKLLNLINKAWSNFEPVLLIGETGIGKTRISQIVASLCGINLRCINLHNNIESSDFVGHSFMQNGAVLWEDGPLVKAMAKGEALLIDEINLAEDSVLERLNSVLEDRRFLFIPEIEKEVYAHPNFRVIATMNPGGDFGKRELSPALRNRFTEIYFELDREEYNLAFDRYISGVGEVYPPRETTNYFSSKFRDLQNINMRKIEMISNHISRLIKGVSTDFVSIKPLKSLNEIWDDCLDMINATPLAQSLATNTPLAQSPAVTNTPLPQSLVSAGAFTLNNSILPPSFSFDSPISQINLKRILRALTADKGILLQGPPGVGKTSIIQALASSISVPVLRINLSEQTEMSDLLGSFIPLGDSISFIPSQLVQFLKEGKWVILDELNLCTQSIIEGLNSILDHRRSIEVNGETVTVHRRTRIFGTMNPCNGENGRKQLPKSFLDRFIGVQMENYSERDIREILNRRFGRGYLFDSSQGLRGNIKYNLVDIIKGEVEYSIRGVMGISNNISSSSNTDNGINTSNGISSSIRGVMGISNNISNGISNGINNNSNGISNGISSGSNPDNTLVLFNNMNFLSKNILSNYVIPHSQIPQIALLLSCLSKSVPVILLGPLGRGRLLDFISSVLSLSLSEIDCSKETDVYDLLGQYHTADKNCLFLWRDSLLLNAIQSPSLVVFNSPETVDKPVFDRLNALFEGEAVLNVYEKVAAPLVRIHPRARFVLSCSSVYGLSPALIDRCQIISLSQEYSYIDLYKIFSLYSDQKDFFSGISNDKLLSLDGLPCPGDVSIDIDIKHLLEYGTLPEYLNRRLGIKNSLFEEEILSWFKAELEEELFYDADLLRNYRKMASLAVKMPRSYSEAGGVLRGCKERKGCKECRGCHSHSHSHSHPTPSFIKTLCFFSSKKESIKINCKEVPETVYGLKKLFMEGLPERKLYEMEDIIQCCECLTEVSGMGCSAGMGCNTGIDARVWSSTSTDTRTQTSSNTVPILPLDDPLKLIKDELVNEKIQKSNSIKLKIAQTAVSIYKYGRGELAPLFSQLENLNKEFFSSISLIEKAMLRNYSKFIHCIKSISFCDYLNNPELRLFLEDFSDVFDWCLIGLFNQRNNCQRCYKTVTASVPEAFFTTKMASLLLINGFSTPLIVKKPEYSKCLHSVILGKSPDWNPLVLEAIAFPESITPMEENLKIFTDLKINPDLDFSDLMISNCLKSLFPSKTLAKIINRPSSRISIGKDALRFISSCGSLGNLSLFSTPEQIINEIQEIKTNCIGGTPVPEEGGEIKTPREVEYKAISEFETFLISLYKVESCLLLERDYLYFTELYSHIIGNCSQPSTTQSIHGYLERFFMDTRVFELLDCFFFSDSLLSIYFHPILYAYTLLYRSFEIEEAWKIKSRQAGIKLRKEPRFYEKTIHEFLDRFLFIPTVKLAEVSFMFPGCFCGKSVMRTGEGVINTEGVMRTEGATSTEGVINTVMSTDNKHSDTTNTLLNTLLEMAPPSQCPCYAWMSLASINSIKSSAISLFSAPVTVQRLMDAFINRKVENPFSEAELCLSKMISTVLGNLNAGKYDEETSTCVLNLCLAGVEWMYPPYLYFVYKLGNTFEETVEEGTGLHDGHGLEAIEEKGEVNDDGEKGEEVGEEGEEMSNEGELYSVNESEAEESNVDAESEEGESEEGEGETKAESEEAESESEAGVKSMVESETEAESEEGESDTTAATDSEAATEAATEAEADSEAESESSDSPPDSSQDTLTDNGNNGEIFNNSYEWKEYAINRDQTAETAEGYTRKVAGGLGSDALQEGMGPELAAGGVLPGAGPLAQSSSPLFNPLPPDCALLTSLLRSVLEANRVSKYKGDFKSGKKLNLKRIVPYIASGFKRDKIWMRRSKNDRREYILRLFIDNSRSMADQPLVDTLAAIYAKLSMSFSLLGIPVELYKFGASLIPCQISDLSFNEEKTVVDWTEKFEDGINIILTDGVFQGGCYSTANFMAIIIDKGGVKTMSRVSILENRVFIEKYLDTFGMKYCIVNEVSDLERVFIESLSELINNNG